MDRASPDPERPRHLQDADALRKLLSHLPFGRAIYLRPAEPVTSPLGIDCSIKAYKLVTRPRGGTFYPDEIDIQETHTKHRKLDSQAALPHPTRDRAADGLRPKAWPLRASRRDHDPGPPIATACGPRRSATCNGSRSSYPRAACTFTVSRMGFPACTRFAVTRCGRFVSYAVIIPKTPTYSFPSEAGLSAPSASTDSSASGRPPRCHSRSIPTCSAMPAGSSSPTMATTRGPCSTTSGTRTFSTRSGTPKWRPTDSRTFGGTDDGRGRIHRDARKILSFEEDDAPCRRDHSPGGGRTLRALRSRGPMPAKPPLVTARHCEIRC